MMMMGIWSQVFCCLFKTLGENASKKGKTSKWVELPIFYRGFLDVDFYHSSNYKKI